MRERLSYQSMQDLLIAHVWLGFFLCYLWLRGKRLSELPCVLGAGVFAFSGYLCTQLQHFGLVAGYIWIPLALWGVDQAVERQSWRPLWKVAAASALCLLAGYPPMWMVFAVAVGAYSLAGGWRGKAALGTVVALLFSLVLCAIQILPTWETSGLRELGARNVVNVPNLGTILSYTLPNPKQDYFYLGVPALLGLPFLIRRRRFRDLAPSLAVLAASLIIAGMSETAGSRYFLAGVTLAFAPLTAYAFDDFLVEKRRIPSWLGPVSVGLMAIWAGYELLRWKHQSLSAGWSSGLFLLVTLAIFGAGIYAVGAAQSSRRMWLAAALVMFVGADYKAFGTSKRFNAASGRVERYSSASWTGMGDDVYQELRANSSYRIAVDDTGPSPNDLRHIGLVTPQGSDELLTAPFRKVLETYGRRSGKLRGHAVIRGAVRDHDRARQDVSQAERQPALPAVGIDADALQGVRVSGCAADLQLGRR